MELALKLIAEAKANRSTRLDLGNCGLTELPDALFELTWLEELMLCTKGSYFDFENQQWINFKSENKGEANNIYYFSQKIGQLSNLKILLANGEWDFEEKKKWHLSDLTPLKDLIKLQQLSIRYTNVGNSHIKYFDNRLFAPPKKPLNPLKKLTDLKRLDISNTQVSDLSSLKNLVKLQQLSIHNTKVSDLSPLKKMVQKGIKVEWSRKNYQQEAIIYVASCPLTNPPREIIEKGNQAILDYWKAIEEQERGTINEGKLIIVGEGKSGKTTLFNKLINPNYELEALDETHGINIHEGLELKDGFRANLWDFGGQELQYMTHQFFLTPRALYVLLMDARTESPNLSYWFKIISLLGKYHDGEKVKLIIVSNKHKDDSMGIPPYQDVLKYYAADFDLQFFEVNLGKNDKRWESLREAIETGLYNLPMVQNQLPKQWKPIRDALRDEAQLRPHIGTDRLAAICSPLKVTAENQQWLLTEYLHQLGSLLHFQNDPDLMDLVVLKPQWAVEGVYTTLKSDVIKQQQKGKFSADDLFKILSGKGYSKTDAQKILKLMSKYNFDICYQSESGLYVAAQLLPENRPPQPAFRWFSEEGALKFRYEYPIMPKGLISRLIVRLSEFIEWHQGVEMVWKKGAILKIRINGTECRVLIQEDDSESKSGLRQILIEVMGGGDYLQNRKFALQKVREEVEKLHQRWFRNIQFEQFVPCNCPDCNLARNPHNYKYSLLLQLKKEVAYCYRSEEFVLLEQILEGVYEKHEIRAARQQRSYDRRDPF